MLRTFLTFVACTFRNGLRVKLRRLREPRYAVGALAGAAWLVMVFGGQFAEKRRHGQAFSMLASILKNPEAAQFTVAIGLVAALLLLGLRPGARPPLLFSSAEVQLLFPAPITRRQLVNYKLLRSLGALLFGSLFMTVLWRPVTFVQGWTFYVGLWIGLAAYRLYSIGAGLASLSVVTHGTSGWRRRWGFLGVIVAIVAVLAVTAVVDRAQLLAAFADGQLWAGLRQSLSAGAARVVLWPFTAVARLVISGSAPAFLAALPGALAVVAAGYLWVIRSDAAFEEAAAAHAEKRARAPRTAAVPVRAAKPPPYRLALRGRPEGAILWKNLVSVARGLTPRMLLFPLMLVLPMMLGMTMGRHTGKVGLSIVWFPLFATSGGMTLLMGPMTLRIDLRRDLDKLAIIKGWPVPGAAIVRGELIAPALLLTALACACIAGAAFGLALVPHRAGSSLAALAAHSVPYAAAAMLATPGVVLAQLLGANTLALLFPAWVSPVRAGQGAEVMGPQLVVMLGSLVAAALVLVPAVAGAGAVMAALRFATGATPLAVPAAVLSVLVVVELLLASRWLGRVLERTDVAAVG
jgi:hypothetical protein